MTPQPKVTIKKLPTGVPGLDDILGGGIPEFSFNILAGSPGCGKTTLAHQIAFANATPEKPVAYFTVFGEAPLKMLRYQQQYTFFDSSKLGRAVRFVNLGEALLARGLNGVLEEITKRVETDIIPHVVVVDSFRSMMRNVKGDETGTDEFIQNLGLLLASWEITSFLVGEYVEP